VGKVNPRPECSVQPWLMRESGGNQSEMKRGRFDDSFRGCRRTKHDFRYEGGNEEQIIMTWIVWKEGAVCAGATDGPQGR